MLKNIKVGKLLVISFLLLCVFVLVVGSVGLLNLYKSNQDANAIYRNRLVPIQKLSDIRKNIINTRVINTMMLYERDESKFAERYAEIQNNSEINNKLLSEYEKTQMTAEEAALVNEYKQARDAYRDVRNKNIDLIKKGDYTGALAVAAELSEKRSNAENLLQELVDLNNREAEKLKNKIDQGFQNALVILLIVILTAFAFSILLAVLIPRSIRKPIYELVNIAEKVSIGDLTTNVTYQSKNEFGYLAKSIAGVVNNLRRLISEAQALTDQSSQGCFDIRANATHFGGGYKDILDGVNSTLDTVVDKIYWYESLLDSIPNPINVTDTDMNLTFLNAAGLKMLNKTREEMTGKQCSHWNTAICKTKDCGIAKLRNGESKTQFNHQDHNYLVSPSYLKNKQGDVVGHIELIRDVTQDQRKIDYQHAEVERLSSNLQLLAQGNLSLDFNVASGDEYTKADRENFIKINKYFWEAKESLSSYISEIANVLDSISKSNIDVAANGDFKGDFAQIKISLNRIVDSLNEILMQINQSSGQVLSGAGQVASGAQALSQGSTEQASSIEELSASIEDISSQIKMNAENAKSAKEISLNSLKTVENANTQMSSMIDAMERINEASQKISKIIKTIDEIAFQTNILALNAAVEAARAGEAGKGFAVVADEVRNLASKSAEAAKETTMLIENSIQAVQQGSRIANETATTLSVIVDDAKRSGELIGQITEASILQAQAIAQTTQGVAQISNVVQNNSATAEESAAASEELSGQADMLNDLVSRFKLRSAPAGSWNGNEKPEKQKQLDLDLKLPQGKGKY